MATFEAAQEVSKSELSHSKQGSHQNSMIHSLSNSRLSPKVHAFIDLSHPNSKPASRQQDRAQPELMDRQTLLTDEKVDVDSMSQGHVKSPAFPEPKTRRAAAHGSEEQDSPKELLKPSEQSQFVIATKFYQKMALD